MSQSTLDQTSNQESSFQPAAPGPTSSRGAAPRSAVSAFMPTSLRPKQQSPTSPTANPQNRPNESDGDWSGVDPCDETGSIGTIPQPQLPQTTETAAVDIGGPFPPPNAERGSHRQAPPSPTSTPNAERGFHRRVPPSPPSTRTQRGGLDRQFLDRPQKPRWQIEVLQKRRKPTASEPRISRTPSPPPSAPIRYTPPPIPRRLPPAGAIENTLFDMLVFAAWQLYKIRDMELFTDLDLGMPGSFGRSEKLARYRGSTNASSSEASIN